MRNNITHRNNINRNAETIEDDYILIAFHIAECEYANLLIAFTVSRLMERGTKVLQGLRANRQNVHAALFASLRARDLRETGCVQV